MIFNFKEENYSVNVKEVFDEAKPEDYIDVIDAFGVMVHSLSHNPKFDNSTIMLVYDECNDFITIEVNDTANDDYCIISEIELTQEERDLIVKKLQCE